MVVWQELENQKIKLTKLNNYTNTEFVKVIEDYKQKFTFVYTDS